MELSPIARDAVTAARATWGVASSRPMPRWQEWMRWIESRRDVTQRRNPGALELERALVAVARARSTAAHDRLAWDAGRAPASRRLYAALVSFVDDYEGPYPEELFPRELTRKVRIALRGEGARTIDEQLAVALEATGGDVFAASIVLHAVTRQVARDRDARALGELPWDERLRDASCIAPFPPDVEGGGDGPGDTYHYWANFAVGYHAELRGTIAPRAVGAAFFAGPIAMTWIRGRLFASPLFAGAHAICDRMGATHGRAVARATRGA